ncbi:alpha/beta fold hydrolase [Kitasatospora sp. NPDC051984]|uniref:alpha/beta fold hydrolase n=1 Tax=Kitasatospora sp. NPDC051984 TaxID=3364059 RepID=UPI0037C6B5C2
MVDEESVDVGGIRLSYRVSGPAQARPLVLLHALGENAGSWDEVTPALTRDRRVYALDLRGHGRSDRSAHYSLDLMQADVLRFLDALGLGAVDVVGHSMGGIVAYLLAQRQPERVRALVLEDVPVPRPRTANLPARPDGELSFDWELVAPVRRQIDRPDPRWLERLGEITAPTLVLAGGPSSHISQEGVAELAARIPGGTLVTIDAGHLIHHAAPDAFLEAVSPFLASLS